MNKQQKLKFREEWEEMQKIFFPKKFYYVRHDSHSQSVVKGIRTNEETRKNKIYIC